MSYFVKGTNIRIQGTIEVMEVCYPITRGPHGVWSYSGETPRDFDETATIKTNSAGENLFLGADGDEWPEAMIEWRDDE